MDGKYGGLYVDKERVYAHRYSWSRVNGPVPEGLMILHKCDTHCCVEEKHLFPGTQQHNMSDMQRKLRSRSLKLSEEQVLAQATAVMAALKSQGISCYRSEGLD